MFKTLENDERGGWCDAVKVNNENDQPSKALVNYHHLNCAQNQSCWATRLRFARMKMSAKIFCLQIYTKMKLLFAVVLFSPGLCFARLVLWLLAIPFSLSFVGSETRFWSASRSDTTYETVRSSDAVLSTCWTWTPSPAPGSGSACTSVGRAASGLSLDLRTETRHCQYHHISFWTIVCE